MIKFFPLILIRNCLNALILYLNSMNYYQKMHILLLKTIFVFYYFIILYLAFYKLFDKLLAENIDNPKTLYSSLYSSLSIIQKQQPVDSFFKDNEKLKDSIFKSCDSLMKLLKNQTIRDNSFDCISMRIVQTKNNSYYLCVSILLKILYFFDFTQKSFSSLASKV